MEKEVKEEVKDENEERKKWKLEDYKAILYNDDMEEKVRDDDEVDNKDAKKDNGDDAKGYKQELGTMREEERKRYWEREIDEL